MPKLKVTSFVVIAWLRKILLPTKLNDKNYVDCERKTRYLLDEEDMHDHLENVMVEPPESNGAFHNRNRKLYATWVRKDRRAWYILLACMENDLIGQFENSETHETSQVKFAFGQTLEDSFLILEVPTVHYGLIAHHSGASSDYRVTGPKGAAGHKLDNNM